MGIMLPIDACACQALQGVDQLAFPGTGMDFVSLLNEWIHLDLLWLYECACYFFHFSQTTSIGEATKIDE